MVGPGEDAVKAAALGAGGGGHYTQSCAAPASRPAGGLRLIETAQSSVAPPSVVQHSVAAVRPHATSPEERERLLRTIVDLCEAAPGARRPEAREALGPLFLRLVVDAEHDIRLRLAERIAEADWAPPALVRTLALDDIDIARPLIASSPVLQDEDLLIVIARATLEHQIAVAARPALGAEVVNGLIETGEPAAMTALAANPLTTLHPDAMERLVSAARRVASLRTPLARRPELSAELARGLYAWVGETLRQALAVRFAIDRAELDAAIAGAASEAHANRPQRGSLPSPPVQDEQAEMEERLVAKLEASGQLKPGYLLRVLRDGRLSLFEAGLAALGGFRREDVTLATRAAGPETLAAACAAVGIDRSAFPTLLTLLRSLNGDRPGDPPDAAAGVAQAFACEGPAAAAAFHALVDQARAQVVGPAS